MTLASLPHRNGWACDLLKDELLPSLAFELPSNTTSMPPLPKDVVAEDDGDLAVKARVESVEKVKGDATYVLSRGKQRVVFELELKLRLEMEVHAGSQLKHILTGMLHIDEISNDDLDDAKLPTHKCSCESPEWKPFFAAVAKASWPGIKASLKTLVDQAKQKWR